MLHSGRTLICLALSFVAVSATLAASPTVLPLPADWYPESVAVDAEGAFYVGSWRQGAVARVSTGELPQVLVTPASQGLSNAQGVLVDARRGALWVCSGNFGFTTVPTTPSALKRYDLASGAPRGSWTLPDGGYCNDLAQDLRGNIYVTDSRHPRVLRWTPQTDKLATWKEDPQLAGPSPFSDAQGPFPGLNGIAIDGGQAVIVSLIAATTRLLRIPLADDGSAGPVQTLQAPRELHNVDALRAWKPGALVLFESNAFGQGPYGGRITLARVEGDRLVLQPLVAGLNDPSSGVIAAGRVWFLESKYGLLTRHLAEDGPIPTGVPFDLQSVALPED